MSRVLTEGIHYNVPAKDYHADPAPEPSLSSSIAKILINKSPKHAWLKHPRLNPNFQHDEPDRKMLIGSAVHEVILGRGAGIEVIDADDYRTTRAKDLRDAALAAGIIPLLRPDNITVEKMADAARMKLKRAGFENEFNDAAKEVVVIRSAGNGVWYRSMLDTWNERSGFVWDIKTTETLSLDTIPRLIVGGYEIQAAFYMDMVPMERFLWLFQEREPPYECIIAEPDFRTLEIGRKKANRAKEIWSAGLLFKSWPGYSDDIMTAEYPGWAVRGWEDDE